MTDELEIRALWRSINAIKAKLEFKAATEIPEPPVPEDTYDRIWKYNLQATDNIQTVETPVGAKILSVDFQDHDKLCLWASVNPDNVKESRYFEIFNYFNSPRYDVDRYLDEVALCPLGENSP